MASSTGMKVETPPYAEDQRGPLSVLYPSTNDTYSFTHTKYPSSGLGAEIPNYIIFFINLPDAARYDTSETKVADTTSVANQNADVLNGSGLMTSQAVSSAEQGATAGAAAGGLSGLVNAVKAGV